MENNKLISNTQFGKSLELLSDSTYRKVRDNYDNFLSQPLAIWQFIPVGDDGDILEEPVKPHTCSSENSGEYWEQYYYELGAYEEAKSRCLFEGFVAIGNEGYVRSDQFYIDEEMMMGSTIEDLVPYGLTLTATAIKKLGLLRNDEV